MVPAGQVAYARIVTDRAVFAWLCDGFVMESVLGQRPGRWRVACIMAHTALQGLRRWMLATIAARQTYPAFLTTSTVCVV